MFKEYKKEIEVAGKKISIETGKAQEILWMQAF